MLLSRKLPIPQPYLLHLHKVVRVKVGTELLRKRPICSRSSTPSLYVAGSWLDWWSWYVSFRPVLFLGLGS